MASNVSTSNPEKYVEERLLNGLFTGSLLQHKELLDMLKEVDVRVIRQSTLLHVGVRLGKADWVEELLARGADPELTDDCLVNALSSAEDMVRRYPEESDRSEVLKLVSLVHRREQVIKGHLESSVSRSTAHTTLVAIPDQNIASIKSSIDALRQEMRSLVSQLSSSLEELKANVCGRDTLLRCLEEAVTSTAEDVTSIKNGLGGEAVVCPVPSNPANARQECVDAMLSRTELLYGSGVRIMHRLYERLYEDDCTACIIKYLSGDDQVKVFVGCNDHDIGRMMYTVVDLDGTRRNGCDWRSFCDLESETVYLGAKDFWYDEEYVCAELARALSQLSLKLVFGNGGRPYEQSDAVRQCEWTRVIQEVEERRKRGGGLDCWINYALDQGTQLAKVCYLAAAVPQMITYFGSTAGRAKLREQAPLLLELYSNHVMPTLLSKARQ